MFLVKRVNNYGMEHFRLELIACEIRARDECVLASNGSSYRASARARINAEGRFAGKLLFYKLINIGSNECA